jgi:hypothetical protein
MAQADRKHMALENSDLGLPQAFSDTSSVSKYFFLFLKIMFDCSYYSLNIK